MPTATEKGNFIRYLKSNQFSTARVLVPAEKWNLARKYSNTMKTQIEKLKKEKTSKAKTDTKRTAFQLIKIISSMGVWRNRNEIALAALTFTSGSLDTLQLLPKIIPTTKYIVKATPKFITKTLPASITKAYRTVKDDPKSVIVGGKVAGIALGLWVIKNIKKGIKLAWLETGVAVGLVAKEYVLFLATGGTLNAAGRISKKGVRKIFLMEDPRLIITRGTRARNYAIEARSITVARLEKMGFGANIKFAKASPVKEPRGVKIVTPEARTIGRGKPGELRIDVPTPSGYATPEIGKDIFLIPEGFLELRKRNIPVTYYKSWIQRVKRKGLLPTFRELGFPKLYSPTIYKGYGVYLPRKTGESLQKYYARGLRTANRTKKVQVLISPKTILKAKQPELEIKTIYPNVKGVKAAVTRVKVGKDTLGNNVVLEIVAPKSVIEKLKFKLKSKLKFKLKALKFLTFRESKIAKRLAPRMIENYKFIYKSKLKGAADRRKHMLKVEKNFRKILKEYKIKANETEIKAAARLHDILKLRGINIKDEPIVRKALLEGYLDKIDIVKKLTMKQKKRVANAIGVHHKAKPGTIAGLRANKFTKALINADRLDITRYGRKVKMDMLFNIKRKSNIPKKIKKEFNNISKKMKKKGISTKKDILRRKILLKKYPGLSGKKLEIKLLAKNKRSFKKMTPKQKKKIRKQEKDYTDYKESMKKYKSKKARVKKNKLRYATPLRKYKKKGVIKKYKTVPRKKARKKPTGKYVTKKPIIRKPLPKKMIRTIPKGFKRKKLSKAQNVYYVLTRRRGKIVKLNAKPLTISDARDYLAYSIDNTLTRSAWFKPVGRAKKSVGLPKKMKGYYSKKKSKLRPYKIKYGKKKQILQGYIEKRKYFADTKIERGQLILAKRKKKRMKLVSRRKKAGIPKKKRMKLVSRGVKLVSRRKKPARRKKKK